jgi:hypothetical protein
VPSTSVHRGAVAAPRLLARSVAPWQYTPLHVDADGSQAAAGSFSALSPPPPGATSTSTVPSRCLAASSG